MGKKAHPEFNERVNAGGKPFFFSPLAIQL
jgi:hypothetical protein